MKTIKIKLYSFNELSETAKNNAIEKWRNDSEIFLDFFNDDCVNLASEKGFKDIELQYSLSYCQGDGLSFSAQSYDNLENLFLQVLGKGKEKTAKIISESCNLKIKSNNGHYCYASKSDVDIYLDYSINDSENIENVVNQVLELLQDEYLELCSEMEKNGYNEIEYQLSDEAISETLQVNDYDFTEEGEIY